MNLTPEQRLRLFADHPKWYLAWKSIDFCRQPDRLPEALRDVNTSIRVPGLERITCSVLRSLLGLLENHDQRRQANILADDPLPNRVQNRFPIAEIVVKKLRHPLVTHYRNPYNFLAAYQTAVTRAPNFVETYHCAVTQIRRSEAAKRRKDRRCQEQQSVQPQQPRNTQAPPRRILVASQPYTPRTTRASTETNNQATTGPIRLRRIRLAPTPEIGGRPPRLTTTTISVQRPSTQRIEAPAPPSDPDLPASPDTISFPSLPPSPACTVDPVQIPPSSAGYLESGNTTPASSVPTTPGASREASPFTVSSTELSPSPTGYSEPRATTPVDSPQQILVEDSGSTPNTPPPPYQETDPNAEELDFGDPDNIGPFTY